MKCVPSYFPQEKKKLGESILLTKTELNPTSDQSISASGLEIYEQLGKLLSCTLPSGSGPKAILLYL